MLRMPPVPLWILALSLWVLVAALAPASCDQSMQWLDRPAADVQVTR